MALKPEHKIFIRWYLKTGDHIDAYMKAYSTNDRKKAATMGGRLLKNAEISVEISKKAEKINIKAENKAIDELKDEIKADLLTSVQKREILREIANGKPVNGRKPSFNDMIRAIEVDNKMSGDEAPKKVDHTTKGKQLPSFPLIKAIEIVHTELSHDSSPDDEEDEGGEADE